MGTNSVRGGRQILARGFQTYHFLIAAWVLAMILVPIAGWIGGAEALQWAVLCSVLLHMSAVIACLAINWAGMVLFRVAAAIMLLAWGIEYIGSTTGIPFGHYHYTERLQPQIAGVPVVVPMAWLMMLPPAWAVGLAVGKRQSGWRFVTISALAFTAWDLFLDPQMVGWGYWEWANPGGYFGIPWVNFLGWFLSAALITLLVRPRRLPVGPLLLIYATTWVLQSIGLFAFWHMPGPALAGCAAMGLLLFLAWHNRSEWREMDAT